MFDKLLIANRGEIALRIVRACQQACSAQERKIETGSHVEGRFRFDGSSGSEGHYIDYLRTALTT